MTTFFNRQTIGGFGVGLLVANIIWAAVSVESPCAFEKEDRSCEEGRKLGKFLDSQNTAFFEPSKGIRRAYIQALVVAEEMHSPWTKREIENIFQTAGFVPSGASQPNHFAFYKDNSNLVGGRRWRVRFDIPPHGKPTIPVVEEEMWSAAF